MIVILCFQVTWFCGKTPLTTDERRSIDTTEAASILTVNDFQHTDDGIYTVIVKNEVGYCGATFKLEMVRG